MSEAGLRGALDLLFSDEPVIDLYSYGPWRVRDGLIEELSAHIDTLVADERSSQLTVGKHEELRTPVPAVVADAQGIVAFLCGDVAIRAGSRMRIDVDIVRRFRLGPNSDSLPGQGWIAPAAPWRPPGGQLFRAAGDDRARREVAWDLTIELLRRLEGLTPLEPRREALLRLHTTARRDPDLVEATLTAPQGSPEWTRLEERWADAADDEVVALVPELTGPVGYLSWVVDGWVAAHERLNAFVPGGGDADTAFIHLLVQAGVGEPPAELAVGIRGELYASVRDQLPVRARQWKPETWQRQIRDWLSRALVAGQFQLCRAWLDLAVRLTGAVQGLPGTPVTPRDCRVPVTAFQEDVRRLSRVRRVRHPLTGAATMPGWVAAEHAFPFGPAPGAAGAQGRRESAGATTSRGAESGPAPDGRPADQPRPADPSRSAERARPSGRPGVASEAGSSTTPRSSGDSADSPGSETAPPGEDTPSSEEVPAHEADAVPEEVTVVEAGHAVTDEDGGDADSAEADVDRAETVEAVAPSANGARPGHETRPDEVVAGARPDAAADTQTPLATAASAEPWHAEAGSGGSDDVAPDTVAVEMRTTAVDIPADPEPDGASADSHVGALHSEPATPPGPEAHVDAALPAEERSAAPTPAVAEAAVEGPVEGPGAATGPGEAVAPAHTDATHADTTHTDATHVDITHAGATHAGAGGVNVNGANGGNANGMADTNGLSGGNGMASTTVVGDGLGPASAPGVAGGPGVAGTNGLGGSNGAAGGESVMAAEADASAGDGEPAEVEGLGVEEATHGGAEATSPMRADRWPGATEPYPAEHRPNGHGVAGPGEVWSAHPGHPATPEGAAGRGGATPPGPMGGQANGRVERTSPRARAMALIDRIVGQSALVSALREIVMNPETDIRLVVAGPPGTGRSLAVEVAARTLTLRGFDGTAVWLRHEHFANADPPSAVAELRAFVEGCVGHRLLAIHGIDQLIARPHNGAVLAAELHRLISLHGSALQIVAFAASDGYRRMVDVSPALAAWWRVVRTHDFDASEYAVVFGRVVQQRGATTTEETARWAGELLATHPPDPRLRNARLATYVADLAVDAARRRTRGAARPMVEVVDLPQFEGRPPAMEQARPEVGSEPAGIAPGGGAPQGAEVSAEAEAPGDVEVPGAAGMPADDGMVNAVREPGTSPDARRADEHAARR
jgi:hypothetical protein